MQLIASADLRLGAWLHFCLRTIGILGLFAAFSALGTGTPAKDCPLSRVAGTFGTSELSRNSSAIEAKLQNPRLDDPPIPGVDWEVILSDLAPRDRYVVASRLLNPLDMDQAAAFIRKLAPESGTQAAVLDYLKDRPFTDAQVAAMFQRPGGMRALFPWLPSSGDGRRTAAALRLALLSRTAKGLTHSEIDALIDSMAALAGFRPVRRFTDFTHLLSPGFTSLSRQIPDFRKQAIGMAVQGGYEREGFGFIQIGKQRGASQVERDIYSIRSALDREVKKGGELHGADPLLLRSLSEAWGFADRPDLVEQIRRRAVHIAQFHPDFFDIRIRIHNFPTVEVLNEIKAYWDKQPADSPIRGELEFLIEKIAALQGNEKQSSDLPSLILSLPGKGGVQERVVEDLAAASVDSEPTRTARSLWRNRKDRDQIHLVDYYNGDRRLSQHAMVAAARHIETLSIVGTDFTRVREIFDDVTWHTENDDLLPHGTAAEMSKQARRIAESNLPPAQKAKLLSTLAESVMTLAHRRALDVFGEQDEAQFHLAVRPDGKVPPRYVETLLRSRNTAAMSLLAEKLDLIAGRPDGANAKTLQAGRAYGVLRMNPDPLAMQPHDIAIFETLPAQLAPSAGIFTFGSSPRLSHADLLARSSKIPHAKLQAELRGKLEALDGKHVVVRVSPEGFFSIEEADPNRTAAPGTPSRPAEFARTLPPTIATPFSLDASPATFEGGAKSRRLQQLRHSPLANLVPPGVVIPPGVFQEYLQQTGLSDLWARLGAIDSTNERTLQLALAQWRRALQANPLPTRLLAELRNQLPKSESWIVRSDFAFEDGNEANGAGLGETIPKVPDSDGELDKAIRRVWASAFGARARQWNNLGGAASPWQSPSVLVMPQLNALASGVVIQNRNKTQIASGLRAGSVVASERSNEDIEMQNGEPYRTSLASTLGRPLLSDAKAKELARLAKEIERTLGPLPRGWDIEWAMDAKGKLWIVQARPAP